MNTIDALSLVGAMLGLALLPCLVTLGHEAWLWFNRRPVMSQVAGRDPVMQPSPRERFASWRLPKEAAVKAWLGEKVKFPRPDFGWVKETVAWLWLICNQGAYAIEAIVIVQIIVIFVGVTNLHNMTVIWALVVIESFLGALCIYVGWQWETIVETK